MIENFENSTKYVINLINLKDDNISEKDYLKILEIEKESECKYNAPIPIITKDVLKFLIFMLEFSKSKKVLEIGTATGYSTIFIAKNLEKRCGSLTSIEIDSLRYNEAKKNIDKLNIKNTDLINDDAINVLNEYIKENKKFDFIFIDARKSIYLDFLKLSVKLLDKNGIIFIDNVLFRSYVGSLEEIPKKYRNMIDKMNDFISILVSEYKGVVLPFGDGVALIKEEDLKEV